MAFKWNTETATPDEGLPFQPQRGADYGTVIPFPKQRRRPQPIPKLELLTALFGAMALVDGPASSEALAVIVAGALPERDEASVRAEVEDLLAYYSSPTAMPCGEVCIFDRLADGRFMLAEAVQGFLA